MPLLLLPLAYYAQDTSREDSKTEKEGVKEQQNVNDGIYYAKRKKDSVDVFQCLYEIFMAQAANTQKE